MKSWSNKHKQATAAAPANQPAEGGAPYLSDNFARNLDSMQSELGGSPDLKVRRIQIGGERRIEAAAIHLSGLADTVAVNEFVIGSLLGNTEDLFPDDTDDMVTASDQAAPETSHGDTAASGTAAPAEAAINATAESAANSAAKSAPIFTAEPGTGRSPSRS